MVLAIAPSLYLFYRALRVDLYLHLFSHSQQEFTGIFHSPSYIGNCKSGRCRNRLRVYLHLERQLQGMIGSMDVEGSVGCQVLGSLSGFERAFEVCRMEEDGGIAIALQNILLHAFIAGLVSALATGGVDQYLALRNAGCRVEKELPTLQFERSMGCVKASAEGPVDLSLRRIEGYLEALILSLCQQGTGEYQTCDDACPT